MAVLLFLSSFNANAQLSELVVTQSHGSIIDDIAISKDNSLLISVSKNNEIIIRDVASLLQLNKIVTSVKPVTVDISEDNKYIVAGGMGGVGIYEVITGKEIYFSSSLVSETIPMINKVCFCNENQIHIITTSKVYAITIENGRFKSIVELKVPDLNLVNDISEDGNALWGRFVDFVNPQQIISFNLSKNKIIGQMPLPWIDLQALSSYGFAENGKYFSCITGDDEPQSLQTLSFYDMTKKEPIFEIKDYCKWPSKIVFTLDNLYFFVIRHDNNNGSITIIDLWNIEKKAIQKTLRFNNDFWIMPSGEHGGFNPEGNKYYFGISNKSIAVLDLFSWKVDVKNLGGNEVSFAINKATQDIIINNKKINYITGNIVSESLPFNYVYKISSDGNYAFAFDMNDRNIGSDAKLVNLVNNEVIYTFSQIYNGSIDPENGIYYKSATKDLYYIFEDRIDFDNPKQIIKKFNVETFNESIVEFNEGFREMYISPNGKYCLAYTRDLTNPADLKFEVHILSIENAKEINKLTFSHVINSSSLLKSESLFFNNHDYALITENNLENKELLCQIIDLSSTNIIKEFSIKYESILTYYQISNTDNYILFGSLEGVYIYDINKDIVKKIHQNAFNKYEFSKDDKFVFASDFNSICVFKINDLQPELLMKYYPVSDNDWLLISPDGRFEGSKKAMEKLYYTQDFTIIPIESFFESKFTPRLWSNLMQNEFSPKENFGHEIKMPPSVKIISFNGESRGMKFPVNYSDSSLYSIEVEVTDRGGGVDEIAIYHNGKLVETTNRGYIVEEKDGAIYNKKYLLKLQNGENTIRVTAYNNSRIESVPDEIVVNYNGIAIVRPNLYLFAVGINDYNNPKYQLNYAVSDAQAFIQEFKSESNSLFKEQFVFSLFDKEATKDKILEVFNEIQLEANESDVFIFYYAGHGCMSEESNSEFYIIPSNVTQMFNPDSLKGNAISANLIKTHSTNIKAQKQVFVLDACQSGGIESSLVKRGVDDEKAFAQLARSTGTFWLTGTTSEQFASEFEKIGHGIFTYCIVQGLSGLADAQKDKKITVQELSTYLNESVPALSKELKGADQYPVIYGFGQDFPIVLFK